MLQEYDKTLGRGQNFVHEFLVALQAPFITRIGRIACKHYSSAHLFLFAGGAAGGRIAATCADGRGWCG